MNEQLISFETAKLAKEKGFDEKCKNWFDNDKDNQNLNAWTWNTNDGNRSDFACVRPTQSLLQKWLREKHHLEITLSYYSKQSVENWDDLIKNNYYISITDERNIDNPKWPFDDYLDTYEEALEKGLQEALKLI